MRGAVGAGAGRSGVGRWVLGREPGLMVARGAVAAREPGGGDRGVCAGAVGEPGGDVWTHGGRVRFSRTPRAAAVLAKVRSGVGRWVLGSVAEWRVIRQAGDPVLVIRGGR